MTKGDYILIKSLDIIIRGKLINLVPIPADYLRLLTLIFTRSGIILLTPICNRGCIVQRF
jgi:hypothetical protein